MMIIKSKFTLLLCYISLFCFSQQRFTGFVKDDASGEVLIGATIATDSYECGTLTNANSYFSLLCKSDSVNVSFVGYQKKRVKWVADSIVTIYLGAGQEINEVTVFAQRQQKFNTTKTPSKMHW
ncbi:MAG: carboxypeptidase-like regulatory domain-containing protein [Prolixibacteraceae bacterium]